MKLKSVVNGLAAAHALSKAAAPPRVTVIEQSARVGGKLVLGDTGEVRLDAGADAVLTRRPEAVDLIRAVGLGDQLVHPAAQGAGVLIEGTLRPIPRSQACYSCHDEHAGKTDTVFMQFYPTLQEARGRTEAKP